MTLRRLAGRYRRVRRIATGGMGAAHEAIEERLDPRVAVNLLEEEYAKDHTFVARFTREDPRRPPGSPQHRPGLRLRPTAMATIPTPAPPLTGTKHSF